MKTFFSVLALSAAFIAEASVHCTYRFNPRLGVTLTKSGATRGSLSWDDKNVCTGDGICTEIYPGTFQVRYRTLRPRTLGIERFRVRSIRVRDDLGNRFRPNSLFGSFVRNARFTSVLIPEPNVAFFWQGRKHVMDCQDSEN